MITLAFIVGVLVLIVIIKKMADQRLTQRTVITDTSDVDHVHVVKNGVSYRQKKQDFLKEDRALISTNGVDITNLEAADVDLDVRVTDNTSNIATNTSAIATNGLQEITDINSSTENPIIVGDGVAETVVNLGEVSVDGGSGFGKKYTLFESGLQAAENASERTLLSFETGAGVGTWTLRGDINDSVAGLNEVIALIDASAIDESAQFNWTNTHTWTKNGGLAGTFTATASGLALGAEGEGTADGILAITSQGKALRLRSTLGKLIEGDDGTSVTFEVSKEGDIIANTIDIGGDGLSVMLNNGTTSLLSGIGGAIEGIVSSGTVIGNDNILTLGSLTENITITQEEGILATDLSVAGEINANGGIVVTGGADVTGVSSFNSSVDFHAVASFNATSSFSGNTTFDANVDFNGLAVFSSGVNLAGSTIIDVADGVNPTDGVNLLQVQNLIAAENTGYTVAGLPAGTLGDRAYVTDATAPTYLGVLTGGGAVACPVFYNGTAWVSA